PRDDQLGVLGLLGPDPRRRTEGADPGLGADAAAERTAIEQAGAEPVEEPEIHRAAGEESVRAGVVEGQNGLRTVRGDDRAEPVVDDVERLRPRDALEASLALGARPAQRRLQTSLAVNEARIRLGHLRAEDARRVRVRARALDRDDLLVLDGDGQTARVGTIERTNTRVLGS